MTIALSAEEDGIEVGFECNDCGSDYFSVLVPADFEEVN
jgi:hypothetical protein